MYDFLKGKVVESRPGQVTLDVGGIGFKLITSNQTSSDVGRKGEEALLWASLHFKEDNLALYGFSQRQEREFFLMLIKVSGIGPRLALQILSGVSPEELIQALWNEDQKRLTSIPGIGPKTARRLLIELKEKLTDQELQFASSSIPQDPVLQQAFAALQNLGFEPQRIRAAIKDLPASDKLENIIRAALGRLSA